MIYEGLYNSAVDKELQSPEAYANANIDTYAGIPELGYTDWRKELIRTAHNQNYEVTASGGNERTTFMLLSALTVRKVWSRILIWTVTLPA